MEVIKLPVVWTFSWCALYCHLCLLLFLFVPPLHNKNKLCVRFQVMVPAGRLLLESSWHIEPATAKTTVEMWLSRNDK